MKRFFLALFFCSLASHAQCMNRQPTERQPADCTQQLMQCICSTGKFVSDTIGATELVEELKELVSDLPEICNEECIKPAKWWCPKILQCMRCIVDACLDHQDATIEQYLLDSEFRYEEYLGV